jgi:uncharacterized protein YjiS (DUF1127 family)
MSTTLNACCAEIVPTRRPAALRWLEDARAALAAAWPRYEAHRRIDAEQRMLREMSEATLRDIGLAERRFDDPTLGRIDWERGRWQ